jgi:hypothetical protein
VKARAPAFVDQRAKHALRLVHAPVTQALWLHVMGANPAALPHHPRRPVENIS